MKIWACPSIPIWTKSDQIWTKSDLGPGPISIKNENLGVTFDPNLDQIGPKLDQIWFQGK